MSDIKYYAELRRIILQMESDMSISSLTEIEKVISALIILSNKEKQAHPSRSVARSSSGAIHATAFIISRLSDAHQIRIYQ